MKQVLCLIALAASLSAASLPTGVSCDTDYAEGYYPGPLPSKSASGINECEVYNVAFARATAYAAVDYQSNVAQATWDIYARAVWATALLDDGDETGHYATVETADAAAFVTMSLDLTTPGNSRPGIARISGNTSLVNSYGNYNTMSLSSPVFSYTCQPVGGNIPVMMPCSFAHPGSPQYTTFKRELPVILGMTSKVAIIANARAFGSRDDYSNVEGESGVNGAIKFELFEADGVTPALLQAAIPEPATWMLGGLGLIALTLRRLVDSRRRRRVPHRGIAKHILCLVALTSAAVAGPIVTTTTNCSVYIPAPVPFSASTSGPISCLYPASGSEANLGYSVSAVGNAVDTTIHVYARAIWGSYFNPAYAGWMSGADASAAATIDFEMFTPGSQRPGVARITGHGYIYMHGHVEVNSPLFSFVCRPSNLQQELDTCSYDPTRFPLHPPPFALNVPVTLGTNIPVIIRASVFSHGEPLDWEGFNTIGGASGAIKFEFFEVDGVTPADAVITPEPSTWMMTGLGILGLTIRRLRRA